MLDLKKKRVTRKPINKQVLRDIFLRLFNLKQSLIKILGITNFLPDPIKKNNNNADK